MLKKGSKGESVKQLQLFLKITADGDFGTISNILPTFLDMVSALQGDNYYGPYEAWVSTTQYVEMMDVYTDGSGQSALDRVVSAIPQLRAVHHGDYLTDYDERGIQTPGQPSFEDIKKILGVESN